MFRLDRVQLGTMDIGQEILYQYAPPLGLYVANVSIQYQLCIKVYSLIDLASRFQTSSNVW